MNIQIYIRKEKTTFFYILFNDSFDIRNFDHDGIFIMEISIRWKLHVVFWKFIWHDAYLINFIAFK